LSPDANAFIMKVPPKHARQLLMKIVALSSDPMPHDSIELKGESIYRRADVGEYRIIYRIESETLFIHTDGNRNDGDVYKSFARKQK
jgi:mRNA interferase RelE/StbE